ncbi:4-carboxymuconolactone decarboxylase [Cladobotryum mycophilum]|uniref:4-carboxymuconolactone decarboxylase n=1 Tax=Cladobotryum mycophilum TaxID=491253 RepID=A0ABR0SHF5_9HYPO
MTQPSEKLFLGAQMAAQFFGPEILEDIQKQARDDLPSKVGAEYFAEVCFSGYARPGLKFRDRCLINIGMLIALNRSPELRLHVRAALHNGLSKEEIVEACRHAMVYTGVPAGREALTVVSDVFKEADKTKGQAKLA